ncbi:hypothetical protein D6C78_09494 [Aureobasidium pullulans]|uniref:C2H2-type domain-containing protein n=1 Tax=Aureobasidium pullulans TaxID=5580 RepID=A0A4T0BH89_AURPU|nr:hypothetical protein D6C78_09494 [Aureobasidium pullulans]
MDSGAGDRHPQGDQPYYNSQTTSHSLNLSEADMDDWTYTPPSHPAEYSSLSTAPSRPLMNTNASNNYANHVEYGAGSYNNHDDIHAAFQATQGFVDENTPLDYRNMTFQDYQQMVENHNATVRADTTQFDDDSFGQYGSDPSTGNYATQVTQVSGQWTGLHGLPNNSTSQRLDYPSPPPPQGSGYVYPQSPYYNSQPVHAGYDPYEYPQQPPHHPTMESPQPQPLTFIEYPSPPQTNARSGVSTTRHSASHTPTKTSRKSSPTASNKEPKTKKDYQERKTIQCDTCEHKATCESNLKQHQLTHNGPKDYHCYVDGCGRSFHRPWGLSRHLKDVHDIHDVKVKKIGRVRGGSKSSPSGREKKEKKRNINPTPASATAQSAAYLEYLQQQQLQQQQSQHPQQTQQQAGFEVRDDYAEQQQEDVDMIIEQEDFNNYQAIPNTPAHTVPSTPSEDDTRFCGPSHYSSPHHDLPHAHDSPMAHPLDTDMDMDVDTEMDNEDHIYPPPSPTTPWTPHSISTDARLDINITTQDIDADTEIDSKPNSTSTALDPFALDTEMNDFLADADAEPFPIHHAPSLSPEEFYRTLAKMQGKEYKDDFFG